MLDIHKCYDLLKEENIILSHQGALDGDLIDIIIQLIDKKLSKPGTRVRLKKKVINVLVECLQNSYHYTLQYKDDEEHASIISSPFLIITQQEKGYTIFTGNSVTTYRGNLLKEKVDEIVGMSDEELYQYYIKSLDKEELPQEGGAGLGLVDIIRRSKKNVKFDFMELDENYQLFSLLIKINV